MQPNTCPVCCTTQKGEAVCEPCKEDAQIEQAFEEASFAMVRVIKEQKKPEAA